MRFSIRPGKATCAGVVVIFMVAAKQHLERVGREGCAGATNEIEAIKNASDSHGRRVKFRKVAH